MQIRAPHAQLQRRLTDVPVVAFQSRDDEIALGSVAEVFVRRSLCPVLLTRASKDV